MSKRSTEYEFIVWLATTTQPIAEVLETARLFVQVMPEVAHLWIAQNDDDKLEWIRRQQFDGDPPVDPVVSYEQWLDWTLDRLSPPEPVRRKAEVVLRYRKGERQTALAAEYGVDQATVSRWCREQGFGEGGVEMSQEEARAMLRELRGSNELMHRIELDPGLSGTLHEIEAFAADAEAETERGSS